VIQYKGTQERQQMITNTTLKTCEPMYVSDRITEQLAAAETRKQALEIILEECFQEDLQDAALDWCVAHRPDLKLDDSD